MTTTPCNLLTTSHTSAVSIPSVSAVRFAATSTTRTVTSSLEGRSALTLTQPPSPEQLSRRRWVATRLQISFLATRSDHEAAVQIASARFRNTSYGFYIDDVWKINPRLTMNLGLRYELTPPWEDSTGTLFTVAIPIDVRGGPVADQSLHPYFLRQGSGDPYEGINLRWPDINVQRNGKLGNRLVKTDYNDFAPRIGVTWSPNSKWVIRAGAGIFYSQDTGNPRFDMAGNLRAGHDLKRSAARCTRSKTPLRVSPELRRSFALRTRSQTSTTGIRLRPRPAAPRPARPWRPRSPRSAPEAREVDRLDGGDDADRRPGDRREVADLAAHVHPHLQDRGPVLRTRRRTVSGRPTSLFGCPRSAAS